MNKMASEDVIALSNEVRENIIGIRQLIPRIKTLAQWQKIVSQVDPALQEQVRELIEPYLPFRVPGVEPASAAAQGIVFRDDAELLK